MFIELAEFLRCPEPHPEAHLVLLPGEMVARYVVTGTVGCPVCRKEYPVRKGTVAFGPPPSPGPDAPLPDPSTLRAVLGLASPGGYVVLVGSAARAAAALSALLEDVHLVGVNAPPALESSPQVSLLTAPGSIPLRSMARGVILGGEYSGPEWRSEGARVLLNGLRLVVLGDGEPTAGVTRLAGGPGIWIGEKGGKGAAPQVR